MTLSQAKKDLKAKLTELEIPYETITGKSVSFEDLARGSMIFLTVKGINWNTLRTRPDAYAAYQAHIDQKGKGYIVR